MESKSAQFFFDSLQAAAAALLAVVLDARVTEKTYNFGGLSAPQILNSGLKLQGEIDAIADELAKLPGVIRYDG